MKGLFGSGTKDFLLSRISSLVLLSYFLLLCSFFYLNNPLTFSIWSALFDNIGMKLFTTIFLLTFAVHTWIGTWAIGSDYITQKVVGQFSGFLYKSYRLFCLVIIVTVTIWSLLIVWL